MNSVRFQVMTESFCGLVPRLLRPRRFVVLLALLVLPLSSALAAVVGTGVQLGHFGVEGQENDYSPPFQEGPQARSYPHGSTSATSEVGTLTIAGQYASVDNGLYGNADLKLNSYFADTVTIDAPGRAGQPGTFTVAFTFDGSFDANLWWDTRASIVYGFGLDAGDGTIPSMSSASNYGLDNGFAYRGDDTYGYGFGNYMFLGTEQTGTFSFTYGQPFDFWLRLGASMHISESAPGDTRLAVSLVKWSGLGNITAGGTPAADVTVSGVSGANWTKSVTNTLPASTNHPRLLNLWSRRPRSFCAVRMVRPMGLIKSSPLRMFLCRGEPGRPYSPIVTMPADDSTRPIPFHPQPRKDSSGFNSSAC